MADDPKAQSVTIVTRAFAQEAALPRYFTGKPCGRGHLSERDTAHGKCVQCEKERSRARYRSNPDAREYHRKQLRKLRADPVKRAREAARNLERRHSDLRKCMLHGAKARASKTGRQFALAIGDVPDVPTYCPVLGIPIMFTGRRHTDNSPTLDRIDSTLGYIPGNVAVISMRANKLKSDASLEEMMLISLWMATHQRSNLIQRSEIPGL